MFPKTDVLMHMYACLNWISILLHDQSFYVTLELILHDLMSFITTESSFLYIYSICLHGYEGCVLCIFVGKCALLVKFQ